MERTIKHIIPFICLLLLSFSANSQIVVSGTVVDNINLPIEFANVVLLNSQNNIITSTITDKKGNFVIKTDTTKNLTLKISFIGFESYTKNIDETEYLETITLKSLTEISEVVITGRKNIVERKDDKIIFKVQNTGLNKADDGLEVLKNTPIIWVNSSDQVLIRQELATIQINGRKVNLSGTDLSNYIRNINAENIQSIEIQTNGSANTDADQTGGVVNIILKKMPKGLNVNATSYYTYYKKNIFDLYNGFSVNYGSKKWNTYLLYNYKTNKGDGYFNSDFMIKSNQQLQSTSGGYNSINGYHNYRLGFATELSKKQNFGLELYGNNNNTTFKKNNNILITNDIPILQGDNFLSEKSEKYLYNVILNYTYKIDTINSKLIITADYIKHNYDNIADINSLYDYGNINSTERNTTNSETDLYSVQADLFKNFRKKIKTELGFKYGLSNRHNSLLSETLTNSIYVSNDRTSKLDYNERIIAGYVSIGYNLNKKNYIKIGLRVENTDFLSDDKLKNDKNTRNYFSWFPSAYYSNKLSENSTISIGYSRRLQRPSFNILNNRVNKINDFSFDIGNPNLKPEFIDKYDISYNLKNHFFSIYFNNTTDAITGIWRIEDSISIHQNQNYGTNKQFGLQYSSANINITKWWILKGNLHLYHRQFANPNFNLEKTTFFFFLRNNFIINKTTSVEIYGNYMSPFLSANYIWAENTSTNLIIKKSFFDNRLNIRLYINDIFNTRRNKSKAEFIDSYFKSYNKNNTRSLIIWISYRFATKKQIRNGKNQSSNDTKNRL